jgi:hypothetical protein
MALIAKHSKRPHSLRSPPPDRVFVVEVEARASA